MKKDCLIFLFTSVFAITTMAEVRLPAIIGNHMVLQQKSDVKLWGWCDPGEKIKVNLSSDTTNYNAIGTADGKWLLTIKTPSNGGPYTLTITGSNKIVLDDVLIGETWVCSGQSNMEMNYNWGIKEYTQDVENSENKRIRFFHIPRLTAMFPQDDTKGSWVVCGPEELKHFSLAGYFFGKKLQRNLNVPVGLIESDWGGTPAEVWTSKGAIDANTVLKNVADSLKVIPWGPIREAATYNAMIYPITNFSIAGVIWYQGEANVDNASTYQLLFSTMINSWRKAWDKNFPFYFVQIAPYSGYGNISGALLREAQTKTLMVPNTGMVVITDLVSDVKNIHPRDKKDVGERLANLALSHTYGKPGFPNQYPIYRSMDVEKGKVKISFDDAEPGLMSKGNSLTDFYIAGADKVFQPANAKIVGNNVIVWNNDVKNPIVVRFGFTNDAIPNLFSKNGLPVNIFRTDDWNDINTIIQK
ncbi:MAG: sialate O-acetylesterase [Bacteroidota bacterium]|nr:sialate O-acetylesterase [Bacteroidota bacterium]